MILLMILRESEESNDPDLTTCLLVKNEDLS